MDEKEEQGTTSGPLLASGMNTQPWPRRGESQAWEHAFHPAHASFEVCNGPSSLGILIGFECMGGCGLGNVYF